MHTGSPGALIVIDHHGHIRQFDAAAERMFGYDAAEVLGRDVTLLMPESDRTPHAAHVERYLRTGEAHIIGLGREVAARRRDGTVFPAELAIGELHTSDAPLFVGFVRDLTERQKAEEEQQRMRERLMYVGRLRTMGEMAANLAHEINQPLAAISLYARACTRLLGESPAATNEELSNALEQIGEQALRAGEVIRQLRAMVKPQAAERTTIDCNRLVSDLIPLVAADARINHIELYVELTPTPLPVHVDVVLVQHVLLNLMRNAIDATIEVAELGRRIDVRSAMTEAGEAEVSVADYGCGLPQGQMERLFEPFFTTKHAGTGLGLSISRTIVRDHGGHLRCAQNRGGGAVFTFTLPLEEESTN